MYVSFDKINTFLRDVRNNDHKITLDVLIEYMFWVAHSQGGFGPAIDLSWNQAQPVNRTALLRSLLRGELPGQERLRDRQWLFVLDSCDHILEVDVLAQLVDVLMHGSGRPGSTNVVMTARTSIKLEVNGAGVSGALEIPLEGTSPHTSHSCSLILLCLVQRLILTPA